MKKLAYIATPYKGLSQINSDSSTHLQRDKEAVRIARIACSYIKENTSYIPVSPVITFSSIYDETDVENGEAERIKALEACRELLKRCDIFVWVDTPFSDRSEGMKQELNLANDIGLRVEIINIGV